MLQKYPKQLFIIHLYFIVIYETMLIFKFIRIYSLSQFIVKNLQDHFVKASEDTRNNLYQQGIAQSNLSRFRTLNSLIIHRTENTENSYTYDRILDYISVLYGIVVLLVVIIISTAY